ncbi:hypothetical protein T459_28184 [Capsicum annuum]|uniref:Uncharacterized protein n=1 Tax=Capsicum annuum TaxID=4072 RepID=A0A2G2YG44_CAPAN|nr:hypothetical protein T459_28184 [Capsicum annuum]
MHNKKNNIPSVFPEVGSGEGKVYANHTTISEDQVSSDESLEVAGSTSKKKSRKVSSKNHDQSDIASEELSIESNDIKGKKKVSSAHIGGSEGVDLSVNQDEPWAIFYHKKPRDGWIVYNPKTIRPTPLSKDTEHVKLLSWNVNGLRDLLKLKKLCIQQLADREDFDVLCL